MSNQGLLVIVSGFSGAGKGTVMKRLVSDHDCYALSISATTRTPRQGETDGKDYFFLTKEEFEQLIAADQLIEYAKYVDNYYGTPKEYVLNQMKEGKDVILEIEIQGALKVKEAFPEALLLFVMPPNAEVLRARLKQRGTESDEVIEARLKRALEEAEGVEAYDYVLINDDLEVCVKAMHEIIACQHHRVSENLLFMNQIREELAKIAGGR